MKRGGGLSGAVSLVMIFCVLCLAVFAVLTLATANRERQLSELTAERAAEYYAADAEATRIVAALARGEMPDAEITWADTSTRDVPWEIAEFAVSAGGEQELQVQVYLTPGSGRYRITRWQTAYTGDWEMNDTIELWDGD